MNQKFYRIFFITLSASALLIIGSLLSGSSLTGALLVGIFPWPFFLLFFTPITLLFVLLGIRPSLDRLSELVTFSLPFDPNRIVTIAQLFGLLTVFLGILYLLPRIRQVTKVPLFSIFTLFLLWGAGTLTYSIDISQTLYELLRLFSIFFIFLLAHSVVNSPKKFLHLLLVCVLSSIIPLATAIYQFVFRVGYTDDAFSIPRIYGTFGHPNIFAMYLIIVLVSILLLFTLSKEQKYKTFALLSFFFVCILFILTYARTAWITFFSFLGILAFFKYPKIIPALILTPILLFFISPLIQERITDAFTITPTSSLSWRFTMWNDTIHQTRIDGNTALGYGLGTFAKVAEGIRGSQFTANTPHSEFVRSFVEGGILGLGVFLLLSFAPILLLWKLWRKNKNTVPGDIFLILGAVFASLLLLSTTDHVLRSTMIQWILWAILGGALRVYIKETSPLKPTKQNRV